MTALVKPSTVTGETGAYSFKNSIPTSSTQNYIDNEFPNLFNINGNNTITGNNTLTGTLTVPGPGTIAFTSGGEITGDPYSLIVWQGTINLSGVGSQLLIGGNLTFETGSTIEGTTTIPNGQNLTIAAAGTGVFDVSAPTNFSQLVTFTQGVDFNFINVNLSGSDFDLTGGSEINFASGTSAQFATGSNLTLSSGATATLNGSVTLNNGVDIASGATLAVLGGGEINVAVGGSLVVQSGATATLIGNTTSTGIFTSAGYTNLISPTVVISGAITGITGKAVNLNSLSLTNTSGTVTLTIIEQQFPLIFLVSTLTGDLYIDFGGSLIGSIFKVDTSQCTGASNHIYVQNGGNSSGAVELLTTVGKQNFDCICYSSTQVSVG